MFINTAEKTTETAPLTFADSDAMEIAYAQAVTEGYTEGYIAWQLSKGRPCRCCR